MNVLDDVLVSLDRCVDLVADGLKRGVRLRQLDDGAWFFPFHLRPMRAVVMGIHYHGAYNNEELPPCLLADVLLADVTGLTRRRVAEWRHEAMIAARNAEVIHRYGSDGVSYWDVEELSARIGVQVLRMQNIHALTRCATSPAVQGGEG